MARHRRANFGHTFKVSLVFAALLAASIWFLTRGGSSEAGDGGAVGDDVSVWARFGPATNLPSPSGSTQRVLPEAALPAASGKYAFLEMHDDVDQPVRFDPCREHPIVIDPTNAPVGGNEVIAAAADRLSMATGMKFFVEGDTDEPYSQDREAFQPDRYGDRWAPIVVWWRSPDEVDVLKGAVAGLGGPLGVTPPEDPIAGRADIGGPVWVTGAVVLDAPALTELLADDQIHPAVGIALHELAHVTGLGHVDDPTQLMSPQSNGTSELGAGDLRGLRELGAGPCRPDV